MENIPAYITLDKEIAEYIYRDDDNNITFRLIYDLTQLDLTNKLLVKKYNIVDNLLCLDLHGVADLYTDNTIKITDKLPIFIISFVGRYTKTRIDARTQIIDKILRNQVNAGILVFIKNKIKIKPTEINQANIDKAIKNNGKAIIINNLLNIGKTIYFIDDGVDNIKAVNLLKVGNIILKDNIEIFKSDDRTLNTLNTLNTFEVNGDNIEEIKTIITHIEKEIEKNIPQVGGKIKYYKLQNF
jgi:hypothetical protein